MVNGSRAIRSSEEIRQERLRRLKQIRKTTRPRVKRAEQVISKGRMNIKGIFDPQSTVERFE